MKVFADQPLAGLARAWPELFQALMEFLSTRSLSLRIQNWPRISGNPLWG